MDINRCFSLLVFILLSVFQISMNYCLEEREIYALFSKWSHSKRKGNDDLSWSFLMKFHAVETEHGKVGQIKSALGACKRITKAENPT